MHRYVCTVCGGNCDAGELRSGICHECRAIINKEQPKGGLIHIIEDGDCLYSIYLKHKPTNVNFDVWYNAIIDANNLDRLKSLEKGEQLLIPEGFY